MTENACKNYGNLVELFLMNKDTHIYSFVPTYSENRSKIKCMHMYLAILKNI